MTGLPQVAQSTHSRLKWDTLQNLRTLQGSNVFHDELWGLFALHRKIWFGV